MSKKELYQIYTDKINALQKLLKEQKNETNLKIKSIEELNRDLLNYFDEKTEEKNKKVDEKESRSNSIICIKQNIFNVEFQDFYDVIIDINSIKDINQGWAIKMNEIGEKKLNEFKNKPSLIIGVIGNSNRGKSFLLSKISKIQLPNGTSIRTEGLSIKYPDLDVYKNRNIILLDSEGLETPLLIDKKNINIKDGNINEIIKEKARDKLMTELFLQNFIINNSDILVAVVGILTYTEQKLLNRIREERTKTKKALIIIHNLMTFSYIKQVEEYINNYLLKDATFDLIKKPIINTKQTKENIKKIPFYYEAKKSIKIFHLIFTNEGSEAGNYYNDFAMDFFENFYQEITDIAPFDCIQRLKTRFIELSKDLFETNENNLFINEDDFFDNEKILKEKKFGLKNKKDIVLKKCYIDELGLSNFRSSGFNPQYNYYKKGNRLIIKVEAPGKIDIESEIQYSGVFTIIEIKGKKKRDNEPKNENDIIYNSREFGDFIIAIPLLFHLSNKEPILKKQKGVYIISYELEDKTSKVFEYEQSDEI